MDPLRALNRCLLLIACASPWTLPAVVVVGGPRPTDVPQALRPHWRALFAAEPGWIEYHLAALDRHLQAEAWSRLLAARLRYDGPAWPARVRFGRPRQDPRRARPAPHAAVRSVLLRSLRWRPPRPALLPVYRQLLASPDVTGLDQARLLDLIAAMQPALAVQEALVLADTGPAVGRRIPGVVASGDAGLAALFWLLERGGGLSADQVAIVQGILRPRLAGGAPERRLALVRALPAAWGAALLPPVLRSALKQGPEADIFLAGALPDLSAAAVANLLPLLVEAVPTASRLRTMALVAALEGIGPAAIATEQRQRLIAALQARILASADLATRHALLGLLLDLDPAAAQAAAGFDSPWGRVARHRMGLPSGDQSAQVQARAAAAGR